MNNKYFNDKICDVVINDSAVILSNKFTGKWIKVPTECYEVIRYSVENSISVNNTIDIFEDAEDKEYFKKILYNLENIGLLDEEILKDIKFSFVPKVTLSITNRCNLKCDYCCVDSSKDYKDILSTDELKIAIDNILKLNPQNIVISGGEPLIRKDFFEILDYIKSRYDGKIILSTNATLIKNEDIKYISHNIHALEISLDGFDEESCSKVRGNGIFYRVIDVIKLFKKNDMKKISLSMVVGKNNVHTIDNFYKLNKELETKPIVRNFSSIGRGSYNFKKYLEDNTVHYTRGNEYNDISNIKSDYCQAGNSQLFVNYDGNMYLCPLLQHSDFKIGHIFDFTYDVIKKIYDRDLPAFDNFNKLKPKNSTECEKCKINIFCTGCPAKMYTLKQNKKAFDYNCNYVKENLMKKIW